MGREGGFSANFRPKVLNEFRELCKEQGKQYTKVLEQLAEQYVDSGGVMPSPNKELNDLIARVNDLEGNQSDIDNAISGASKTYRNFDRRLKTIEQQLSLGKSG